MIAGILMKMKIFLFTTLLLAVASLGLALPQKSLPSTPVTPALPAKTPTLPAAILSDSPDQIASVLEEKGVSKKCAATLVTIVTSPEFLKCIPVDAFTPLLPIVTDPGFIAKFVADPPGTFKKVEPALVTFSTKFCAAPKCSDEGIAKTIAALAQDCADEIQNTPLIKAAFSFTVFYSPLHDDVCFKSHNKGTPFCWDESFTTILNLPKSPIKIVDGGFIDSIAVADPEAVCTTCNKDIIDTFLNFMKTKKEGDVAFKILEGIGLNEEALKGMTIGAAVKCGIKFIDGKVPDNPGK